MKDFEEVRRYVHERAAAVPESEARHILNRARRTWQEHPGRWRRPQTVLAVGLALATIASIGFVQIWRFRTTWLGQRSSRPSWLRIRLRRRKGLRLEATAAFTSRITPANVSTGCRRMGAYRSLPEPAFLPKARRWPRNESGPSGADGDGA